MSRDSCSISNLDYHPDQLTGDDGSAMPRKQLFIDPPQWVSVRTTNIIARHRLEIRLRRKTAGRCSNCGYDIRGYTGTLPGVRYAGFVNIGSDSMIHRRLFNLASVLSILLCLAMLGLWARSYGTYDAISYDGSSGLSRRWVRRGDLRAGCRFVAPRLRVESCSPADGNLP